MLEYLASESIYKACHAAHIYMLSMWLNCVEADSRVVRVPTHHELKLLSDPVSNSECFLAIAMEHINIRKFTSTHWFGN